MMADPGPSVPTPPSGSPCPAADDGPRRIRSRPTRTRTFVQLPGTEAASDGGDMNWRRGIAVLWTLFILIAAGEAFVLAVSLLAGDFRWPTVGDFLRLTALCGVFLALWFGWTWTRWVLAVTAFLTGVRTILVGYVVDYHGPHPYLTQASQALAALLILGVMLTLGVLYLLLAAYLAFSADVIAFTRHRREEGRSWVVIPVGLLVGSYCVLMLGAGIIVRHWLGGMFPTMHHLVTDDTRAMAAQWDPDSMKTFLDAEALKGWSDNGRAGFMDTLRPLGTYLGPGDKEAGLSINIARIGTGSFIRG